MLADGIMIILFYLFYLFYLLQCGMVGHLTFQCRNHLGVAEKRVASSDSDSSSSSVSVALMLMLSIVWLLTIFLCHCCCCCYLFVNRILQVTRRETRARVTTSRQRGRHHAARHLADAAAVRVSGKRDVGAARIVAVVAAVLGDVVATGRRLEAEAAA